METSLRIFLFSCIAVYFVIIAVMLKKHMLGLRYALLWIVCGIGILVVACFPDIIFRASAWVGISNPVNAMFFLFSGFTVILLLSLTSIASKMSEQNLRLTQALALLEGRVYQLEKEKNEKRKAPDGEGVE